MRKVLNFLVPLVLLVWFALLVFLTVEVFSFDSELVSLAGEWYAWDGEQGVRVEIEPVPQEIIFFFKKYQCVPVLVAGADVGAFLCREAPDRYQIRVQNKVVDVCVLGPETRFTIENDRIGELEVDLGPATVECTRWRLFRR